MEEKRGFFRNFFGRKEEGQAAPEPEAVPIEVPVEERPTLEEVSGEPETAETKGILDRFFPFFGKKEDEPPVDEEERKAGFFRRLKDGLSKTHESLVGRIDTLLLGKKKIDDETLEELEEILITADVGVTATADIVRGLEQKLRRNELSDGEAVRRALKEDLVERLSRNQEVLDTTAATPFVILVIGVNGAGKTTTIAKLACRFLSEGKSVLLAAGDTFRAAAAEQLEVWGKRVGVDVVRHQEGADPSAVVFDACKAAVARKSQILIVDTAGRLHTKVNLMEELKKIRRIIAREIPAAPHETLLVLDATNGQNAVSQARIFGEAAAVSGIALTKLDGSAKGGVLVAIKKELGLPVRFIGIGEKVEDLRDFDAVEFVDALF